MASDEDQTSEIYNNTKFLRLICNRESDDEISDEFKALVQKGIDLSFKNPLDCDNTALHRAILNNDLKFVEYLLNLNSKSEFAEFFKQEIINRSYALPENIENYTKIMENLSHPNFEQLIQTEIAKLNFQEEDMEIRIRDLRFMEKTLVLVTEKNSLQMIEGFLEAAQKCSTPEEVENWLSKTFNGSNIFHLAAKNNNEKVITFVLEKVQSLVSPSKMKEMLNQKNQHKSNVLHILLMHNKNLKSFENLLDVLMEVCDHNEIQQLVTEKSGKYGKTSFMLAAEHKAPECIQLFWYFIKDFFTKQELKQILLDVDSCYRNAIHLAVSCNNVNVVVKILKIYKTELTAEELQYFLQHIDRIGLNLFNHAAKNSANDGIFKVLKETMESCLIYVDVNNMFKNIDKPCYFSALHTLLLNTSHNNKKSLEEILKMFKQDWIKNELNQIRILSSKRPIINCLMHILTQNTTECFEVIWNFIKKFFNNEEREKLFLESDMYDIHGLNPLQFSVKYLDNTSISEIHKIMKNEFDDRKLKRYFQQRTIHCKNLFHLAALNSENKEIIPFVTEMLQPLLTLNEIKAMLRQKELSGLNPFQLKLVESKSQESLKDLAELWEVYEIKFMLIETSYSPERNCFMFAAAERTSQHIETVWSFIKIFSSEEELEDFLMMTDFFGLNALQLAVRFNDKDAAKKVLEIYDNVLNIEKLNTCIQKLSLFGQNLLELAVLNESNEKTLTFVKETIQFHLTADEIKEMLRKRNENGSNFFRFVLYNNKNPKSLDAILNICKKDLDFDEMRQMIAEKTFGLGMNSLMFIASCSHTVECLVVFWDFVKFFFKKDKLKQFLLETDEYGNDIIHITKWISGQNATKFVRSNCNKMKLKLLKNMMVMSEIFSIVYGQQEN